MLQDKKTLFLNKVTALSITHTQKTQEYWHLSNNSWTKLHMELNINY